MSNFTVFIFTAAAGFLKHVSFNFQFCGVREKLGGLGFDPAGDYMERMEGGGWKTILIDSLHQF